MATYTMDKFTYGGNTYVLQDSGALQLTGGNVTGPVNFGDSVSMDDLTTGQLIVTGNASFANHINANTITATTPAAGDNSTNVATTAFVTSALSGLTGPMMFIGTVGTGGTATSLPTAAAANKGYTYKVITALTTPVTAKVGDTVISTGSTWVVIPSGDEPSGTVTSVAVANGGALSVSGSPITSSGTITISHADTSSQGSITANGRKYITGITLDGYGHVTGLTTGTETVTDTDTHYTANLITGASATAKANAANTTTNSIFLNLVENDTVRNSHNIVGSGATTVSCDANGKITISSTDTDTNTNYYHTTGSWSGLTYTATANGGAGALAFTIPTGTTSTTVAAGNHTHSNYVPMTSTSVSVQSDEFRIRNNQSSATAQAGTSNAYVTSLLLGDGREATIDEYGDGYLGIHGNNGIFLHPQSGAITVYDPSKTYSVGSVVWYNRAYYRCTTAITTAEAWTSGHWTNISASNGNVKVMGHIYPAVTGTYDLGSSSLKWNNIYATTFSGNATSASKLGTTTVGSTTKPIYLSNGSPTESSTYAGGTKVTLNNSDKGASTASFYAPTSGGTSGYYLKSNGSTSAPTWTSFPTIPTITLNGTATTSPSFYAPTSAGTNGYVLKSNGSGAPSWVSAQLTDTITTVTASGTGNVVTGMTATNGAITYIMGTVSTTAAQIIRW